jgi:DNA polymerase-3 subunit delta
LRNPTPGVTLVFDAGRFDFDGEDKTKLERVRKFYAAISAQVELRRYTTESARKLAAQMARDAGLRLGAGEIELLVEALGADAASIANEIEKLRLYSGGERPINTDVIAALIPNGRATNIFALVAALGSGDRRRSLDVLDTLVRAGEYLPLALSFLATQFRLALVAHEANLRGAGQIQGHFSKIGTPMWRARAEQVHQTMTAFPRQRLETALGSFYAADKALRDTRPDDRIIMEELVWNLTR